MPGNAKRRRRKHRGTQTGSIDRRGRSRPRNRQEAAARARNQRGARPDRRDLPPTWRGAAMRGLFFAALLFPVSLLFNQPVGGALILTVIAAGFYIPLGYYTDAFFYKRRKAKLAAQREAKKQSRGAGRPGKAD
jgi:hypothetical protein